MKGGGVRARWWERVGEVVAEERIFLWDGGAEVLKVMLGGDAEMR